jgi:2',3'-cyclic-nucleotide 2'-phosphodiesterase (5'-nucleotidase family)
VQQYVKREGGPVLQLDLGNYFMPLGQWSEPVNQLLTESIASLPLHVMNLGPEDLFMWKQLSAVKTGTARIVSTNLSPKDSSVPAPERYAVIEVPGDKIGIKKNLRIGFLGLSNPSLTRPNSGFVAADPLEAVARIKPEVIKKADFLVILADLPKVTSIRLAKEHPEIYAIMMVERAYIDPTPEQVNNAVLVWSMERGRYLGQLVFELDADGNVTTFRPTKVPMDANVPTDQALLKRQNELDRKIPSAAH